MAFVIKKLDQCCLKIIGIGWRNILYIEYDIMDNNFDIDPTPVSDIRNSGAYNAIQNYIDEHGIKIEHAIQSVPYWIISDGSNRGQNLTSMPKIPFPYYHSDTEDFYLDQYNINVESTENASLNAGQEVDMAFYCDYEGVEELDDFHDGRGTDDNQKWGHYMFNGDVFPYLYADNCVISALDNLGENNSGTVFYGGNYNSYFNSNLAYPYMCPILAIQGTKSNALSIALLGWAFRYPYFKMHEDIEPGYHVTDFHIATQRFDYGVPDLLLEDRLYCSDTRLANDFLNNSLFIRFGRWAEDMDPFEGWGDQDEDNPNGGDGDGYLDDELIEPTVPDVSAFNKFFTCYKCTWGQLASFADFCWSPDLVDNILKFYTSPGDAVLGIMFVPFSAVASGGRNIFLGNVDSGVSASVVERQFQMKDCGSIFIPEPTKTYLDYSPYTKYQIFLPFVGVRELDADDIVGKNLGVKYALDMLSGACVAHVTVNGGIKYSFAGQFGMSVPITSQNLGQSILAAATAAAGVGVSIASGGAAAPAAGAMAISNYGMTNAAGAISSSAGLSAAMKPGVAHGGSMGSAGGWLSPGKPFLFANYPNIVKAHNQQTWQGYPTFRGSTVGGFSGYTQFEAIKLKATKATAEEQKEILELLKGGVFL